jgi:hypothetical protein
MKKTWMSCSRADLIVVSLVDYDVYSKKLEYASLCQLDSYLHALG